MTDGVVVDTMVIGWLLDERRNALAPRYYRHADHWAPFIAVGA